MKTDWDLIREILIRAEELPDTRSILQRNDFEEEQQEAVAYHIQLLIEANIVRGQMSRGLSGPTHFTARGLTWEGHELLDSIRSDTVWNTTKQKFTQAGVDMTLDLVKSTALRYAANALATL